jgi:hypothetical protein
VNTIRLTTAAVAIAAVALLVASLLPSQAVAADATIVLPGARSAEGIATGEGTTFYAGDLNGGSFDPTDADAAAASGDIYRGDYATGEAELFIDAPADGRYAVGLSVDVANGLLFVAGGPIGNAYAYDLQSGEEVAVIPAGQGFVNDVVVTEGGAWITNSNVAALTFVPVVDGVVGTPETLELSGPATDVSGDFNLNGIDVLDADTLVVSHTQLGAVFTVDATTGATAAIALDQTVDGDALVGADGILLQDGQLLVVENFANRVVVYDLTDDPATGTLRRIITDEAFDVPTTVAGLPDGRIAVVNAKFSPTDFTPSGEQYEVVVVDPADGEAVGVTANRLAGADRFGTSVAISQRAFPAGADEVFLARADDFADALSGGSLTTGPILLVPACGELPSVIADEIARLAPDTVTALGGEAAVCDEVLAAAVSAAG